MVEPALRTLPEAVSDVRYATHYGELNERFWRHFDTLLNLVGAAGGSSAIAGVMAQNDALNLVAGCALAVVSTLQLVLRPSEKATEFRDARRAFLDLEARAWDMQVVELDAASKRIQLAVPTGLRWLAKAAWNANVCAIGHEDRVLPLRWYERLAHCMA